MEATSFQTGCRYWPRAKGPFFLAGGLGEWAVELWDAGEVRDELAHVADVGFDFVRVGLPWERLHPEPTRLSTPVLDRVEQLLEAASRAGLAVQVTLLGVLGGTLFVPRWLLATDPQGHTLRAAGRVLSNSWEPLLPLADLYAAAPLVAAQRWLWAEIAHNFAAHPALVALDLGAGGLLSAVPPRRPDDAFGWWEPLAEGAAAEGVSLLYSDGVALLGRAAIPPLDAWRDATGRLALLLPPPGGGDAAERATRASFLLGVAHTLAHAPVGCAALGMPTDDGAASEEAQARFLAEALPRLHEQGVPFVCYATWADAPPTLRRLPPLDQSAALARSGLLRADGSEKEAAGTWRHFHKGRATWRAPQEARALELDEEAWYRRRAEPGFVETLFRRYQHGDL